MAREPKNERLARRRAALIANARRLEKKIQVKGEGHPLAPTWKAKLQENARALEVHRLQGEIEKLQRPGDHSIEVPAGSLAAEGQKAGG